jgi:hypothetical protein
MSTRAAAVVQASTQANMLTAAPRSMATPSGEDADLGREKVERACGLDSTCDDWPRKPSTSAVRTEHEEHAGQNGTLQHGARNGLERFARLAAQRGGGFKTHKS